MKPTIGQCTISVAPHAFVSKNGEAIVIGPLEERGRQQLLDMYLAYEPKKSFNGLPPDTNEACARWVHEVIENGISLVARSFWEGVVGHTALFPMSERRFEILIVVSPRFQNMGIGTQLARCAIHLTREIGFESIWLTVDTRNLRARHIYERSGFSYLNGSTSESVEMILDLMRYREAGHVRVSEVMSRETVAVFPHESCETAIGIFVRTRFGALPVINENREVIGILSETDLLRPSKFDKRVGEVMTRDVITVDADHTVDQVIRVFQVRRVRCLPVLDRNKKLVGVIGRKDILAYYARTLPQKGERKGAASVPETRGRSRHSARRPGAVGAEPAASP